MYEKSSSPSVAFTILMVPPAGFKYNEQTAVSNLFQSNTTDTNVTSRAMGEFTNMVNTLMSNGVRVLTFDQPDTLPDAVFPNNWFSTQVNEKGETDVIIYPMLTVNRQAEVNPEALVAFLRKQGINVNALMDMREKDGGILEGTGSMVLDRKNKVLYASISERTDPDMVTKAARLLGNYQPVMFKSYDKTQHPIYHTNVMMGMGENWVVVCLESIMDPAERQNVVDQLTKTHKVIINISQDQMSHMCGNVLELVNDKSQPLLVMSQQAFQHFTAEQRNQIEQCGDKLVPVDIETIETVGGGSARCMMAEVYEAPRIKR
jgi:hypothetical protein